VAVDAPALAGAQQDLVEAEARDPEEPPQRHEALLRVRVERGEGDAGLHARIVTAAADRFDLRKAKAPAAIAGS
jgi:hypothetical protein